MAEISIEGIMNWIKSDPRVMIGLGVVVGLVVLYFVLRGLKFVAEHLKGITWALVAVGAIIFIGIYMQFTWVGWAGVGMVIVCCVAGFGFAMSSRRPLG